MTTLVLPGTSREHPASSSLFRRFEVRKELRRSCCWQGYDVFDRQLRCEGTLHVVSSGAPDYARRLEDARRWDTLNEPGIVRVYELGTYSEGFYVLVEHAEGTPLSLWMTDPRSLEATLDVFIELARAIATSHARGLAWGTIQPEHVLLDVLGRPRIANAPGRIVADRPQPPVLEPPSLDMLRRTYAERGFPATRYQPPEQEAQLDFDARSDQYAWAVALWEALTGKPPFVASSAKSLFDAKLSGSLWHPPQLNRRFKRALTRALSPLAKDRWPSMNALLLRLERAQKGPSLALWGLGACTLVTAGGALASSMSGAARCREQATLPWDEAAASTIEAQQVQTRGEHDVSSWQRARTRIDAYADEWTHRWTLLCDHGDPAASQPAFQCLTDAQVALATLVEVLQDDAGAASQLLVAVDELPTLVACDDAQFLAASREERDVVAKQHLIRGSMLFALAQLDGARASIERLVVEGETPSPSKAILAEALLLAGQISAAEGDPKAAATYLLRAHETAAAPELSLLRARAALALAELHLDGAADPAAVTPWLQAASEHIDASGGFRDPKLIARLVRARVRAALMAGDRDRAKQLLDDGIAMLDSRLDDSPHSLVLLQLATDIETDAASKQAAAQDECTKTGAILGHGHQRYAGCLERLAELELGTEDTSDAREHLLHAIRIHDQRDRGGAVSARSALARLELTSGNAHEAVALLRDALKSANDEERADLWQQLGDALVAAQEPSAALRSYEQAVTSIIESDATASPGHHALAEAILAIADAPAIDRYRIGLLIAEHGRMPAAKLAPYIAGYAAALAADEKYEAASAQYKRACELALEIREIDPSTFAQWAQEAAASLRMTKATAEAAALLEQALDRRNYASYEKAVLSFELARALWDAKLDDARAVALGERALNLLSDAPEHAALRTQIENWLDE